ncbi:MAG TPA: hypothetical protein VHP11_07815, partial [Tepidisphaeraceae bacterium]|nr:hypothetical protein [Tepidisphaeraceae bacterium]
MMHRILGNGGRCGMLVGGLLCLMAVAAGPRAGVVEDASSRGDAEVARILGEAVREAGYEVVSIGADVVCDGEALAKNKCDLLVVPNARALPLGAVASVRKHLEAGGDLIACGLPAWDEMVVKIDGKWRTRSECEAMLGGVRAQQRIVDFEGEDMGSWRRSSNVGEAAAKIEVVKEAWGQALHVGVPNLTGWDTLAKGYPKAFPAGHTVTCFRAKGGERTKQMLVEWMEKDGSRWIATVNLTPGWKEYALPPEAFVGWELPAGRGKAGDHLRVENVEQFSIGLGMSHGDLAGGRHEYWFDDLGTAVNPLGDAPRSTEVPQLEMLSPGYVTYEAAGPVKIGAAEGMLDSMKVDGPVLALHARPGAAGFGKRQPYRWQTLLYAQAENGDYRGAVAAMVIPTGQRYRGSVWAAFTPTEARFYQDLKVRRVITETAKGMRRGVFLQEGGAGYYTAFEGQAIPLGARVMQVGQEEPGEWSVRIRVVGQAGARERDVYDRSWRVRGGRGEAVEVRDVLRLVEPAGGRYVVTTELRREDGGEVTDRLRHELYVYRPKDTPRFIEARDGGFWLDGKRWKAHGVNYMPSSGIAQAEHGMFEQWLGAAAYDPEIIERDLERIRGMKLNSVSVFLYHQSLKAQNLLDFLRRCEAKGLKVNLSLRPGTPLDFRWELMREMIETLRLAKNDTVFAYDLAWEPSHFDHKYQ